MSVTTVKLLAAAADMVGGVDRLAARLGISETVLLAYMADVRVLPDALLLRAVDIILEHRSGSSAVSGAQLAAEPPQKTT
jgi:hypothetical protein